jgi:gliding motility-associated-like protein
MVSINAGVRASFTNNASSSCGAPATIRFTNTTTGTGSITYNWDFGDGNSSVNPNPVHVYSTTGSFTVRLVAVSSNGCRDTVTVVNAIRVGTVSAGFTARDSVCTGAPLGFTGTSSPAPVSVRWDFGNGTVSTALNPVVRYATPGLYRVKMVASFGACADSAFRDITVMPKPVVNFTTFDTASCKVPYTVYFSNLTTGAASYAWSFGNGQGSSAQNPSTTYTAFGSYRVQQIATSAFGCVDTVSKSGLVVIKKPSVSLNNLPDSGCIPFAKNFSANIVSASPIATYLWDFGDGTVSNLPSPSHTYTVAGVYPVSLVIFNEDGCTDTARMVRAIAAGNKPNLLYDVFPRVNCARFPVNFRDSTAGATGWFWSFGDGSTSTQSNPTHRYQDTGYFNIKLKVWSNGCPDSVSLPRYVYINPPIAKFTMSFQCAVPLERVFTNKSIGADSCVWYFGDGTSSSQWSPVHTYALPGVYIVTLTAFNRQTGCDFTQTLQFRVVNAKPAFVASDTTPCRGVPVVFSTGLSPTDIVSYTWDFGDGSPAVNGSAGTVSHTFNRTGLYSVRMIMRSMLGCSDTLLKTGYIRVFGPDAGFSTTASGTCLNSLVRFTDSSTSDGTHPISKWIWQYGDGAIDTLTAPPFFHSYTRSGQFVVSLKVVDAKGCTDTARLTRPIIVSKPGASFRTTDTLSCPGKLIRFTNTSQGNRLVFNWDFGDGFTSADTSPIHTYTNSGQYTVRLRVTDLYGCTDSMVRTAVVNIVSPVSSFNMSDSLASCPPLLVNFTDRSANSISRVWDFGDSTSTSSNNPSHFYTYPGSYTVKLTVTAPGGCTRTSEKIILIKGPRGNFSYSPLIGCKPLRTRFEGHTQEAATFIWDFSDGNIRQVTDSLLVHDYVEGGNYVPRMILVDPQGCRVPIAGTDTIKVKGVEAAFRFDNRALCDSGTVSFSDSSLSNENITAYSWVFGDGGTSNQRNPAHRFTTPGTYLPKLIVNSASGCSDTMVASVPVRIVASPKIAILSSANGCAPLDVNFTAQLIAPDTSAIVWNWNFANGNTAAATQPAVQTFSNAGIYPVSLSAGNSSGCITTVQKDIEAYVVPVVKAGDDFILCTGTTRKLQASGALNYTWTPATALSCTNCATPITSTTTHMQYAVTGTTVHGCSAHDTVQVTVKEKLKIRTSNNASICRGSSVRIGATGASTYRWTPQNGLNNATDSVHTASPDLTTRYQVVGSDDVGCFTDTAYINIKVYPIPTVEAGPDRTINVGSVADLVPVISSDVTQVDWQPTYGMMRNVFPGISVKPTQNTEYTVEVKNAGGCLARDKVNVFVVCNGGNIFIPNTFSPNNDGVNDLFYPRGTGLFKIKTFKVFSRWGELMFEKNSFNANDASFGWDGSFKGKPLNVDVYVYVVEVICENNAVLLYKGNVALVR